MKNYNLPFLWVTVLAVAAGFAGGLIAGRFSINRPVVAPEPAPVAISEPAEEVRAKAFQLVDDDGSTHAALGFMEGGPALLFYDSDHRPRVVFDMTGQGDPRLFLMDAVGTIRTVVGLGLGADGHPFMRLRDKEGHVLWSAP